MVSTGSGAVVSGLTAAFLQPPFLVAIAVFVLVALVFGGVLGAMLSCGEVTTAGRIGSLPLMLGSFMGHIGTLSIVNDTVISPLLGAVVGYFITLVVVVVLVHVLHHILPIGWLQAKSKG